MRIAFLGFGLIAGSVARALRGAEDPVWRHAHLVAWTPSGAGPARAVAAGVIDAAADEPSAAIVGANLVVLGAPPLAVLDLVEALGGPLREALWPGAVVTDVASTKSLILAAANARGLRFVGGHPMAGREQVGFEAATAVLFVDRPWIVIPGAAAEPGDGILIEDLARACRAEPLRMTADEHDAATAGISHLPLVAAVALVEAVAGTAAGPRTGWPAAAPLAAGGWRDMTRLARGDAAMGAGIAATNPVHLAAGIRGLRGQLDEWLAELERDGGPDADRLTARFLAARDRLERDAAG
jgi:prephenate dehydrogenase